MCHGGDTIMSQFHPSDLAFSEAGLIVSILLFGILTAQVYNYFSNAPVSSWKLHWLVYAVWTLEMLGSTLSAITFFNATVGGTGLEEALQSNTMKMALLLYDFTPAIFQTFLTYRTHQLGRGILICIFCWALSFVSLAMVMSSAMWLFADPLGASTNRASNFLIPAASAISLVANIMIVVAFCLQMRKHRGRNILRNTRKLIDKLIFWALQTGLATSIVTLCSTVLITRRKATQAWLIFYFMIPKIYAICLLSNFNDRAKFHSSPDTKIIIIEKKDDA